MTTTATLLTSLMIEERSSILRSAERIVGNRDDAEEVTQTLWIKIQQLDGHPPILRKRAFLFRLARNLALDFRRNVQRRIEIHEEVSALLTETDDAPGQDRIVNSASVLARVIEAAKAMPEPTRTIFWLNRFKGLSQSAIAERIGVSTTTVENHIRRALAALSIARDGM